MSPEEKGRLTRRMFLTQQLSAMTNNPVSLLLMGSITGLSGEQAIWVAQRFLLPVALVFGVGGPYFIIKWSLDTTLPRPGDAPGDRLARLLSVPRMIERWTLFSYAVGIAIYSSIGCFLYGVSWLRVPWAVGVVLLLASLVLTWTRVIFERQMMPYVVAEFHAYPKVTPVGRGYDWPRQIWYLPYAFALFVTSTLGLSLTIVVLKVQDALDIMNAKLTELGAPHLAQPLTSAVVEAARSSMVPIIILTVFLLVTAGVSAWFIARQQQNGAAAVYASINSLISGSPSLPAWTSTDEVGDMAFATARVFEQLKDFSFMLRESAVQLRQSAEQLSTFNTKQSEMLTLQASALQETQVTAQEIKQTSILAAQKAAGVLQHANQAESVSSSGEVAVERSMEGLKDIRQHVMEMASHIRGLEEQTRQIGNITRTVKDLADQSNMLALNAAIEAVRSGEGGKGFGVVAREIRSLADQSIRATGNVRQLLQQISEAIRAAVQITERGSARIESSLKDINAFGDNIRLLSGIVRDNSSSVRQISDAVTQQNAGIGQIFQAVNNLSDVMEETMKSLQSTTEATERVRAVADKVSGFVSSYGWDVDLSSEVTPSTRRS